MNPTLRQIRSFLAVAELGSFTKAAQALNLSQPSLTVQIRQLEESLNLRLIDRNTRSVNLTASGRELLPAFRRIVNELDLAISSARDVVAKKRGTVRLACLPSFAATLLPSAISAFRADHPDIHFVVKDAVGKRITALVKEEAVDFGITAGRIADPELNVRELMEDRIHVILPRQHPLASKRRITPSMLTQYPLILMDEDSTVRQVVNAGFAAAGEMVIPAFEATYMATAVGMARAGLGIALLPSSAIEAQPGQDLASTPIEGQEFGRTIWILRRAGRSLAPAAEAFLVRLSRACINGKYS